MKNQFMRHLVLVILLLTSCSRMEERKEQTAAWIGHSIEEVKTHRYFSRFQHSIKKLDEENELVTFQDGSPMVTKARCQGIGGCVGIENWCEHKFSVHMGKITYYEQYGPCPYDKRATP